MVHFQCPCCQAVVSVESAGQVRKATCTRCGQQLIPPEMPVLARPQRQPVRATTSRRKPWVPPTPPEDVLYSGDIEVPVEPPSAPVSRVAPPTSSLRFPAVPYRPEGGFRLWGMIKLFSILAVGAALVGMLASLVGQMYYVILLYPLAMGIALAFIGYYAVNKAKIRNPALAGFAGLLAGMLAIVAMHFSDYKLALRNLQDTEAPIPGNVRFALTQQPRFEVYLVTTAQAGFRVCGDNDAGFNLGPQATWAYWMAELVLVCSLTTLATRSEASAPFCSQCGQWKSERFLGRMRGQTREVVVACRRGDLTTLNAHGIADRKGDMALSAWVCPQCALNAPIDVQVEQRNTAAREDGTPAVLHLTYPGEALPVLEDLFNGPRRAAWREQIVNGLPD